MIDKNEIVDKIVEAIKEDAVTPIHLLGHISRQHKWPPLDDISLENIESVHLELTDKHSKEFTKFLLNVLNKPQEITRKNLIIGYMKELIGNKDLLINLNTLKAELLKPYNLKLFQDLFPSFEDIESAGLKFDESEKEKLVINFIKTHENIGQLETFFTQHTWAKGVFPSIYESHEYKNAAQIAMTKALNDLSEQKTPNCDSLGLYYKLLYPNGKIPYEDTFKILKKFFSNNTELDYQLRIEVIEKLLHISTIRGLEGVDQSNEEAKEAAEKAMFSDFLCLVEISNFLNATPEKDASKTLNLDEPVKSLKKALEILNSEEPDKLLDAASVLSQILYRSLSDSKNNESKISEFKKATFTKKREMLKHLKDAINNALPEQPEQKEQKNLFFDSIDTLLEYAEKKEEQEKTQKEEKERQEKERQEEQKKNSMKKALVIGAIVGCGLTAAIYATSTIALASPLAIALIVISSLVAAGIGFYGDQKWAEYSAQKGEKMDTAEIAL